MEHPTTRIEITFTEPTVDLEALAHTLHQYQIASLREVPTPPPEGIFFKVKNRLEKIDPLQIRWVQASDIYSIIRTHQARYLVSHTLKSLEERLSSDIFCRVHRSYLVNVTEIRAIEDGQVLIGEDYIPVGQTHREALYARLDFM